MQSDRQARIKDRAYHIWLTEGRVHGKHDEHWHRAEREIAEEEKGGARGSGARRAAAGVAEASGGTSRTPRARAKAAAAPSEAGSATAGKSRKKAAAADETPKKPAPRKKEAAGKK